MVSAQSSRASSRGSTSHRYRTVSKGSEVDESLFGSTKPGARTMSKGTKKKVQIESIHTAQPTFPIESLENVTISGSDLHRMRGSSNILSPEQVAAIKKAKMAAREKELAQSKLRKQQMLKLEEERKKRMPPTETERLKLLSDQKTLSRAEYLQQEEHDDVKSMNRMLLYAKCVTIRDQQIMDKQRMMEAEEEEERKMDLVMEIERIKALQAYGEREVQRAAERKRGAQILNMQIQEREKDRIRLEELRDQEREHMLAEIDRMKAEEKKRVLEKKDQGRRMLEEVAASNREQIERKKLIKIAEEEEDRRITRYLKEKDAKEQALLQEKERIAKEKELETARLRAQQEKVKDRQAELDELRARRAQEAYEREWREKERREIERVRKIHKDLAESRESQKQYKLKQLADMAAMEELDFKRIIQANRAKDKEENHAHLQQMEIRTNHRDELLAQIQANEEFRGKERKEYLEEGKKLRQQHLEEKMKLEHIKSRKLKELEELGVPDKYRAELERKRVLELNVTSG
ncbi:cilia- and flagella-associated protein 45 [Chloropicon primus]|uniref:Cilia- and flagella-associated protein 45 n=1 Tax=Chloropicon primus TaxID=1764295 RepID=A0A5B8MXN9_9CHLO|nr:hypothetical protein A3770_16p78250 [Chloropicon primus]UPR04513.1 cilia- and flagella-associated protein 45 [Chloropicon primus]|eukprot:QDZ25307.1 hypothetical protein A3770_16p78250 [Chloropicon primus]